jgi:hypothetical protein
VLLNSVILVSCTLLPGDNPQIGGDSRVIARRDVRIQVFRHHPGIMDTKANMQAKRADERTIMNALRESEIGFNYCGGLGSGYILEIRSGDLELWQRMIQELNAKSKLRFYKPDSVDRRGFGLLPVNEKDLLLK